MQKDNASLKRMLEKSAALANMLGVEVRDASLARRGAIAALSALALMGGNAQAQSYASSTEIIKTWEYRVTDARNVVIEEQSQARQSSNSNYGRAAGAAIGGAAGYAINSENSGLSRTIGSLVGAGLGSLVGSVVEGAMNGPTVRQIEKRELTLRGQNPSDTGMVLVDKNQVSESCGVGDIAQMAKINGKATLVACASGASVSENRPQKSRKTNFPS